ncbi:MAG: HNH endonuclease, partial [Chloroflexi bacterium]|nr:HNH endonuclease [Chloroflexota bacterium]
SYTWSGQISKEDAKELLIKRFGPVCWGCGYEPRRPNGSLDATLLEVDHIRARRAAEGTAGDDELYNLALLHRTCNGVKRNRLTLEELRRYNADNGLLYVDTVGELVDLFEATRFAAQEISRRGVFSTQ